MKMTRGGKKKKKISIKVEKDENKNKIQRNTDV